MGDERDELVLHAVEAPQALVLGPLAVEEPLPLFCQRALLGDVDDVSLPVADLAALVAHRNASVLHPDLATVPRDHPVLQLIRVRVLFPLLLVFGDRVAVVRMDDRPEAAVDRQPLLGRVADELLYLR